MASSDSVQEIKDKLSVVDIVGAYVKLTKAGKYWKGLCPFHGEKTPSFMVSPERGFYHCFGCGKGGDMFSFVEDIENIDFKGALRLLAEKAGVTIAYEKREGGDEKEKLLTVLTDAADFYRTTLETRKDVKEYLTKRGLKEETLVRFKVGYAPNDWRALSLYLQKLGHNDRLIDGVGLTKLPENEEGEAQRTESKKPYDRFRGRIMFPIRDISGRTVGFSGRIFEDDPKYPQAKYINSPETAVFHKSRILYGFDMAKEGIRKYDFALLVEGQVDLLMAHQSGFTNAVALSGTSFTETHASLIKRHTENLAIAFDGDAAGIAAAGRAAALSLKIGLNTKIVFLPGGKDPADILAKEPTLFKASLREARHVVDFYLAHLRESEGDERSFRLEASRIVLPFVALIQNAIDREHFIERVGKALGVGAEAVRQELAKQKTGGGTSFAEFGAERQTLENARSTDPFLSRSDTIERLLSGMLQVFKERGSEALFAKVHEVLIEAGNTRTQNPEEERAAIIEADLFLADYEESEAEYAAVEDLIQDFKKERKRKRFREKTEALKKNEASGNAEDTAALLEEIAGLAKEL